MRPATSPVLNRLLRAGLAYERANQQSREPYEHRSLRCGSPLVDDVAEVLAYLEGESFK